MISVQSPKLRLIPLNIEQLHLLAKGRNILEKFLNLTPSNFELNAETSFLKTFEEVIVSYITPDVKRNPENYQWFTHWLIIDIRLNLTLGGIGVNGLPDENGELLLGYFVDKKFENRGVATEAVQLLSTYLFQNNSLKTILADTLKSSIGSHNVLKKNGFTFREENDEGLRWELKRDRKII